MSRTIRSRAISIRTKQGNSRPASPPSSARPTAISRPPAKFLAMARGTAEAPDDCGGALCRDRRAQPRDPVVHGGDVQARHAASTGGSAGQPDRGGGLDCEPRRDALPDRAPGRSARSSPKRAVRSSTKRSTGWLRPCAPSSRARRMWPPMPDLAEQDAAILALRDRCLRLAPNCRGRSAARS